MPRGVPRAVQHRLVYTTLLSIVASTSYAQDSSTLDCSKVLDVEGVAYNLASLAGEHTLRRVRDSPPSTMEDELRFDLCHDLGRKDGVADSDQCSTGIRACLTKTNKKSEENDRVFAVIPVAQTSNLAPTYAALQSPSGLSVTLHAPVYPPNESGEPQSLNLTLLCTRDGTSDPTFVSYASGVMSVEWSTDVGCPAKRGDGETEGDENGSGGGEEKPEEGRSSGSGIGWFLLFLCLSFVGYFALGAYYNYNNFGATGWDLIPHRDFWRDVPYLMRDFTEHLCSTLRPGRQGGSRRGYMAV